MFIKFILRLVLESLFVIGVRGLRVIVMMCCVFIDLIFDLCRLLGWGC